MPDSILGVTTESAYGQVEVPGEPTIWSFAAGALGVSFTPPLETTYINWLPRPVFDAIARALGYVLP